MSTEELKGMIGKGVQSQDGSVQGKLLAMHGDIAVVKTDVRTLWIDGSKLQAWELPEGWGEKKEEAPAEQKPAEAPATDTVTVPGTTQKTEHIELPRETAPEATTKTETVAEPAPRKRTVEPGALVPHVEPQDIIAKDQEFAGTIYDVRCFGWTVIYKGELCRVGWVATDGTMGVLYHGEVKEFEIADTELS